MLVLEFMEGGDLWSALRGPHREELQWYGRGRALALDIARGLHFLHEHKAGSLLQRSRNLSSVTVRADYPEPVHAPPPVAQASAPDACCHRTPPLSSSALHC